MITDARTLASLYAIFGCVTSYREQVSALIAANIRAARARQRVQQDQIAELMRELGYTEWRRQTVSSIEREHRRISADELLGLAKVLGVTVMALSGHR